MTSGEINQRLETVKRDLVVKQGDIMRAEATAEASFRNACIVLGVEVPKAGKEDTIDFDKLIAARTAEANALADEIEAELTALERQAKIASDAFDAVTGATA